MLGGVVGEHRAGLLAGARGQRREVADRDQIAGAAAHGHARALGAAATEAGAVARTGAGSRAIADRADLALVEEIAPHRVGGGREQLRHARQLALRHHQLATVVAGRGHGEQERVGSAVDELERDVVPVLLGVVVHERPALECGEVALADDHAIARAPHRRLREVADADLAAAGDVEHAAGVATQRDRGVERRTEALAQRGIQRPHRGDGRDIDAAEAAAGRHHQHEGVVGRGAGLQRHRRRCVGTGGAGLGHTDDVDDATAHPLAAAAHDRIVAAQADQHVVQSHLGVGLGRQTRARAGDRGALAAVERDLLHAAVGTEHDQALQRIVEVTGGHRHARTVGAAERAGALEVADAGLVQPQLRQRQRARLGTSVGAREHERGEGQGDERGDAGLQGGGGSRSRSGGHGRRWTMLPGLGSWGGLGSTARRWAA